jgi:colanic acid biosynthesis protein WcaH
MSILQSQYTAQALDEILKSLPDPNKGLSDAVFEFVLKVTPMINVDLLVKKAEGQTLLAWREDRFGKGWHVPGGIIRFGEHSSERIAFVAREELGAQVESEEFPCDIIQYVGRRGHFISLLYRCRFSSRPPSLDRFHVGDGEPKHGALVWMSGISARLYPSHEQYSPWLADGSPTP